MRCISTTLLPPLHTFCRSFMSVWVKFERAHASVFRWQRGDVLLIDNARVLHDGMPGFGPRRLRVALLGELPLPQARAHRAFLDTAQKKSC